MSIWQPLYTSCRGLLPNYSSNSKGRYRTNLTRSMASQHSFVAARVSTSDPSFVVRYEGVKRVLLPAVKHCSDVNLHCELLCNELGHFSYSTQYGHSRFIFIAWNAKKKWKRKSFIIALTIVVNILLKLSLLRDSKWNPVEARRTIKIDISGSDGC